MVRTHSPRRAAARLGATLAATVLAAGFAAPRALAAPQPFTLASGVDAPHALASDATRQVYWAMDPQGTSMAAYRETGQLAGTVPLGFKPTDVEAMATHDGAVYLGDIGDAAGSRDHVTVYRMAAPAYGQTGSYHAWDLGYPDGAHDAAAMLVSSKGTIYVVTRGANAAVYRAPATPSTSSTNRLLRVASAPAWVTDATFVSDNTVALRTYTSVVLLDAYSWKTLAQAPIPGQPDGQELTTALGSTNQLMAGSDTAISLLSLPTTMESVSPAPSAAPGSSASASASATPTTGEANTSTAKRRTGTLMALVGAALLSAIAAAVVAIKR